jgi:hypothetical protein
MKHEYLLALLDEHPMVILPGIGAFSKNDSKTLPFGFNEYLKFNDGTVASFISKKEGISLDEAGKKLETFCNGMKSVLDSGSEVIVQGIGRLRRDGDKINFTIDVNAQSKTVEEKIAPIEPEKKPVVPEPLVPPVSEQKNTPPMVEVKKEIEPEKKITPPVAEIKKPIAETPPLQKETKQTPEKETAKKERPSLFVRHTPDQKQEIKEQKADAKLQEAGKKKKNKWVLWTVLGIVVLGGGGAGFLFKDEIAQLFSGEKHQAQTEKNSAADSTEIANQVTEDTTNTNSQALDTVAQETSIEPPAETENVSTEEPVKTASTKTTPTLPEANVSSGTYYVVVGCYSNENNASAMIAKTGEKGLSGTNIGTYGGLIHVAVYSSSDESDAAKKAMEIRGEFPNAWIFHKK